MNTPGHPLAPLLRPAGEPRLRTLATAVIPLLALSALLVLLAAYAMPDGYSWRLHSISESAAQGQHGAWIARLSFLSFGAAVLVLSGTLNAATTPGDMGLPGLKLHALQGGRSGTWSVTVRANWRITFRFEGKDAVDVDYEDYH